MQRQGTCARARAASLAPRAWQRRRRNLQSLICNPQSVLGLLLLLLFALPASAQRTQAPTSLVKVTTKVVSNAVRVTLQADGNIYLDNGAFFQRAMERPESGQRRAKPIRRVPLRLWNCRSKVGSFVDVGRYPVSHLEITVPPEDPFGVGIGVEVVLYRDAMCMSYNWGWGTRQGWDYSGLGFDITLTPDRQSLIFTILSDRLAPRPVERVQPGPEHPERLSLEYRGGEVLVTAQYVPLRRLLGALSEATGESFTVADEVDRTVSLHLQGIPVRTLLRTLGRAYGLAIEPGGDGWIVTDGVVDGLTNYTASNTRRLPLKYLTPADAADLLPNSLIAQLHSDVERNAIVASGPDLVLDKIAADLARVDVAPPQIEVEALVLEHSTSRDVAAALGFGVGSRTVQGEAQDQSLSLSIGSVPAAGHDVHARVRALVESGLAQVRAQPKVLVVNGRSGSLFVGSQRYVPFRRSSYFGVVPQLRSVPVGVTLGVTPCTGGAGVNLDVSLAVTMVQGFDAVSGLPILGVVRSTASVRAEQEDAVLITGLKLAQGNRSRRKIPILGDLPLFGVLFRDNTRRDDLADVTMLVIARVVEPAPGAGK